MDPNTPHHPRTNKKLCTVILQNYGWAWSYFNISNYELHPSAETENIRCDIDAEIADVSLFMAEVVHQNAEMAVRTYPSIVIITNSIIIAIIIGSSSNSTKNMV